MIVREHLFRIPRNNPDGFSFQIAHNQMIQVRMKILIQLFQSEQFPSRDCTNKSVFQMLIGTIPAVEDFSM